MPEQHGIDIAALLLLLAKEIGAAHIRRKLELRQDDDGIDTPDDDDDAVAAPAPAPAPTTTDPATATTSAASTTTASSTRQLDTGSKAGIAIGVIVFVIFLGGVVFMYWRHRRGQRWGRRNKDNNNNNSNNNDNYNGQYPNQPNMAMATHNVARKSVSDSSPPLGSISPPSTNPDAGRPWFDNGHGSSELPSREARDSDGVAGWVYDKAELSAPEAGSAQAPGHLHPHHQYHQYPNSTELPTAGNQIHEIPEASACSYAPVELPAAAPDHSARYSGFTGFSGGEGEDVGRNVSTRTSNTDESANRRESLAPTFTVSSPATTVAETVSDSGYGHHMGQVSPASPYARSAAGGNTM